MPDLVLLALQGQTPSLGMIIVATAVMILIWPRFAVGIIKGLRS